MIVATSTAKAYRPLQEVAEADAQALEHQAFEVSRLQGTVSFAPTIQTRSKIGSEMLRRLQETSGSTLKGPLRSGRNAELKQKESAAFCVAEQLSRNFTQKLSLKGQDIKSTCNEFNAAG